MASLKCWKKYLSTINLYSANIFFKDEVHFRQIKSERICHQMPLKEILKWKFSGKEKIISNRHRNVSDNLPVTLSTWKPVPPKSSAHAGTLTASTDPQTTCLCPGGLPSRPCFLCAPVPPVADPLPKPAPQRANQWTSLISNGLNYTFSYEVWIPSMFVLSWVLSEL